MYGGLCGPCPPAWPRSACRRQPTGTASIELTCAACQGSGCGACTDGRIALVGCPLEQVDAATWMLVEAAELLAKGLPPVAGGLLDQAGVFLAAASQVRSERAMWRAKTLQLE